MIWKWAIDFGPHNTIYDGRVQLAKSFFTYCIRFNMMHLPKAILWNTRPGKIESGFNKKINCTQDRVTEDDFV